MDELDHQLIGRLRGNARTSVAALAKQLRVARGTIQNRIGKLERDGTIVGYTVRLGSQLDVPGITALMTISVDGNQADAVLRSLRGDPAVQNVKVLTGANVEELARECRRSALTKIVREHDADRRARRAAEALAAGLPTA